MINPRILTLAVFAAVLLGGSAAGAQTAAAPPAPAQASMAPEPGAPHHHRHNRMMVALQHLNLSADQKAKIKDIMTTYRTSRTSASPEAREQVRGQVEGVLTPDQRTQFEAQMKAHPAAAASPSP